MKRIEVVQILQELKNAGTLGNICNGAMSAVVDTKCGKQTVKIFVEQDFISVYVGHLIKKHYEIALTELT